MERKKQHIDYLNGDFIFERESELDSNQNFIWAYQLRMNNDVDLEASLFHKITTKFEILEEIDISETSYQINSIRPDKLH
jgi:hypothetical protein